MSYNIKGQRSLVSRTHIDDIADVIRRAAPDVAGLQEVHRHGWQSRGRDQAAELERATGMKLFFGRSFGSGEREYGNAILTRGEIVGGRVEPLPGRGEPRSLLVSTVDVDGFRMQACVTHLSAWGRLGSKKRLAQAQAVAAALEKATLPLVLTGDFNSTPTSEELRVFHNGSVVTSCFVADVVTHRATKKCLDYIFAGNGWTIRDARVLENGPSDHWPIVAELERA